MKTDTRTPGVWFHRRINAWMHGYMFVWLHGRMVAWLHGCMVTWLHEGVMGNCLGTSRIQQCVAAAVRRAKSAFESFSLMEKGR